VRSKSPKKSSKFCLSENSCQPSAVSKSGCEFAFAHS
jgi:hypothetical protein